MSTDSQRAFWSMMGRQRYCDARVEDNARAATVLRSAGLRAGSFQCLQMTYNIGNLGNCWPVDYFCRLLD